MEWQCSSLQWVEEHGNEQKSVIWIFYLFSAVPDCPPPPSIRNGVVIVPPWGTPLYTVVEYFCKVGTRMVGNQTLECLESSEWSSDPPVCKGMVYTWQELRKWKFNEFLKYADLQSCQVMLNLFWYRDYVCSTGKSKEWRGDFEQWNCLQSTGTLQLWQQFPSQRK